MCERCDRIEVEIRKAVATPAVQDAVRESEASADAKMTPEQRAHKHEVPGLLELGMLKTSLLMMLESGANPRTIMHAIMAMAEPVLVEVAKETGGVVEIGGGDPEEEKLLKAPVRFH